MSDAWLSSFRGRVGARRVAEGPGGLGARPLDSGMGTGVPMVSVGGMGVPQPLRMDYTNLLIGPVGAGASGTGSGSGTVEQVVAGTAISVSPGSSGASSYTVSGAYSPGTLIGIAGATINCTIAAGTNLAFSGNTLNAANQTPQAGYGIRIDSTREVNIDSRVMSTWVLLNATYDGSVISTGQAPLDLSPQYNMYRYRGVPVKITALGVSGTPAAYSVTVAADDTEPFAYGTVWSAPHVDVYNLPTAANTSSFRGVGVNFTASDFPAGYSDMGIGEKRDPSGGPSAWQSVLVRCDRYDLGGGTYRWIICENPDFDGSCSQGDAYYSSLPEVLTAAEF